MDNEKNVLDELNKGACMGRDAIYFLIDKVKDKKFAKVLMNQFKEYNKICKKISKIYPNYSDKKPHETSKMTQIMSWYGIEMRTFLNQSNSKIAELLIQGTNMGIIEGRKLLNNKEVNKEIYSLLEEFIDKQQSEVEKLKYYL